MGASPRVGVERLSSLFLHAGPNWLLPRHTVVADEEYVLRKEADIQNPVSATRYETQLTYKSQLHLGNPVPSALFNLRFALHVPSVFTTLCLLHYYPDSAAGRSLASWPGGNI